MSDNSQFGTASEAILAVSRLLQAAVGQRDPYAVRDSLVREARAFFRLRTAALIEVDATTRRTRPIAGDIPPTVAPEGFALDGIPPLQELIDRRQRVIRLSEERARALKPLLADGTTVRSALLLAVRGSEGTTDHALIIAGTEDRVFDSEDVEVASAFANAAAAALAQLQHAEAQERKVEHQAALTRAAKTLHESLDLDTVLARICQEAATILEGDIAVAYRGTPGEGLAVVQTYGMPPEVVGYRMGVGQGLAGKVLESGYPMMSNDYARIAQLPPGSPLSNVRSALAAPLVWDGQVRGALSVGYLRTASITGEQLTTLGTLAEFASAAFVNASTHAGLALAARTDGLTGCLNHAAMQEGLRREIDRAERAGTGSLSLVLIDLDDFKQVNEQHGHLVGDEVLRRAGHALRQATRPYDLPARYGGDEFCLIAPDADEPDAVDIAVRAIERISFNISELSEVSMARATAGVAEWTPGTSPTELIARADRALLYGKHEHGRGSAVAFSVVPDWFKPGRFARQERGMPTPPPMPPSPPSASASDANWFGGSRDSEERLRKRSRQLLLANALGSRLSAMTDPTEIIDATVDELHRAFGYYGVAINQLQEDEIVCIAGRGAVFVSLVEQHWRQSVDVGVIGRALRERRAVLVSDTRLDPDFRVTHQELEALSELVVPVWVGDSVWGVINIEETQTDAFAEDDLRLLETISDQVGSALRSAGLYAQLERAYMGTAEALAAALEARTGRGPAQVQAIVDQVQAIGGRMGMGEAELRDVRFGAIFHDIGKIAVSEAILNKPGALTPEEQAEVQRHTIVGEQILAPVDFLAGVRLLVRHEHERWDGLGYPEGLAGEDIPLGARIILVCDAYAAMTSDRPYRPAMQPTEAHAELARGAGTQFDPRVVATLFEVLGLTESLDELMDGAPAGE